MRRDGAAALEIAIGLRRDVAANCRWAEELTVIENIEGFGADPGAHLLRVG
jgi:hypothetical protein